MHARSDSGIGTGALTSAEPECGMPTRAVGFAYLDWPRFVRPACPVLASAAIFMKFALLTRYKILVLLGADEDVVLGRQLRWAVIHGVYVADTARMCQLQLCLPSCSSNSQVYFSSDAASSSFECASCYSTRNFLQALTIV